MPSNLAVLEQLRWKKFPVLDDGFVCLVDVMGDDQAIVQAARVSYGEGTHRVSDDRTLIRYLMRHHHSTPFEMAEIKLLVRVPMDSWRQWIRHRTACLAGGTQLSFDLPGAQRRGGRQHHAISIEEFYRLWHEGTQSTFSPKKKPTLVERVEAERRYTIPELSRLVERRAEDLRNMVRWGTLEGEREGGRVFVWGHQYHAWATQRSARQFSLRDRLAKMMLRTCNEQTGEIDHTNVTDIWQSGVKPVFRVTLENGYQLKMTEDHLCLTSEGWMTLKAATALRLRDDGGCTWNGNAPAFAVNGMPAYQDRQWLADKRQQGWSVSQIADAAGVSYHTIRKYLRKWSQIARIEYAGEEMTYDLSVAGPHHNFVANGFIVHNSVNEYSTRYSIAIDAAQATPPEAWRVQSTSNRQGSEGFLEAAAGTDLSAEEAEFQRRARDLYQQRLERGVAREQARKDLPLSTYTEAYWKIDLHNLLRFLQLRMDPHAQWEIRQYAEIIGREVVRPLFPLIWEAFVDYRLEGMQLSRLEQEVVARLAAAGKLPAAEADFLAAQDPRWAELARCRERDECRAKLAQLGLLR